MPHIHQRGMFLLRHALMSPKTKPVRVTSFTTTGKLTEAMADTIGTEECDFSIAPQDATTQALVAAWKAHGGVFEAAYRHGGANGIQRLRPEPAGIIPPWFPFDPKDANGAGTKNQIYDVSGCANNVAGEGGVFEFFTECSFRNPYLGGLGDYVMVVHAGNQAPVSVAALYPFLCAVPFHLFASISLLFLLSCSIFGCADTLTRSPM